MKTKTTIIILFFLMAALSLVTANSHEKAAYAFSVGGDDQPIKTKPGFLNYNNLLME